MICDRNLFTYMNIYWTQSQILVLHNGEMTGTKHTHTHFFFHSCEVGLKVVLGSPILAEGSFQSMQSVAKV